MDIWFQPVALSIDFWGELCWSLSCESTFLLVAELAQPPALPSPSSWAGLWNWLASQHQCDQASGPWPGQAQGDRMGMGRRRGCHVVSAPFSASAGPTQQ